MSWIKDNKFLVALGGGTLVAAVLLFVVGSKGKSRYDQAKVDFDSAAAEAAGYERLALYPRAENRDGKRKALDEYRKAAEELQAAFEPFRVKEMTNVSPQDFTETLKTTNEEIVNAFNEAGTKIPDAFFSGFENYKTSLARSESTGVLNFQLASVRKLLLALAAAGPSELKNFHRPALPEEDGRKFEPAPGSVARAMPVEITFMGTEKSVREFLSAVVNPDDQFVVIRSLRISNAKKDPPRAADAKFESATAAPAAAAGDVFGGAFDGGFVLPGDDTEEEAATGEGDPAPAPAPKPAPAAGDSGRILSQVLGNEEVQVFLRLDVMQFLPAKKLP
jgi:hypothetical protein